MKLWRVVHERHSADAWSGEGGRLVDGRWHTAGRRIVYASEHAALAVLEKLVHLPRQDLAAFRLADATLPDDLVRDATRLPPRWDAFPAPPATRALGDDWLERGASAALRVPSSLVPGANVLVNPAHPGWKKLVVGDVRSISFCGR